MRGFVFIVALLLPFAAHALESAAVRTDRVTATLISDMDAVRPGVPMRLGLRLRLAPGWHTYWVNPGDAGVAPELTLSLPEDAVSGPISWPTPQRLPGGPLMTYGYTGEVILPVVVTPGEGALQIEASVNWLVCEMVCVPEEGVFRLDVPNGTPVAAPEAALFDAAAARAPRPSPFAATYWPNGTLNLAGEGLSQAVVTDAWFFPLRWGVIDQGAPQPVEVGPGYVRIGLRPVTPGVDAALEGIVVLKDPGGRESYLSVSASPGSPPRAAASVWHLLALAFAGGLLLNLMPCVFPILAMKAVALAQLAGRELGKVRGHALAYTGGVLVAFAILAAVLLALRSAGIAAGWGFQFQAPVFVAIMAWLLFSVGLNLSGVYEIGFRLAGAGQGLAGRAGWAGSFFTGLLAVVVATPCTAPFMGVAIAAALLAPIWQATLVFMALGLGLAAPYLLLALRPQWASALPRPGPWLGVLRGVLAFPMYAAAAWLVWVVSLQAGPDGVLATVAGLVCLGLSLWALGLAQRSGRRFGVVVAVVAACAALALVPGLAGPPKAVAAVASEGVEPFSPGRLAALRAEGRAVFVNMTAAWCVTCLVNERLALGPAVVRETFAARGVVYLKGDWTRADPAISSFLREHDRDGVPLYVLYPPGNKPPVVLPQILTQAGMLSELNKLGS